MLVQSRVYCIDGLGLQLLEPCAVIGGDGSILIGVLCQNSFSEKKNCCHL